MILTTKQKQYLKGLAHHLNPVVMLGGNGLTEGVLVEIDNALNHHELIKVKVAGADRDTKQLIINATVPPGVTMFTVSSTSLPTKPRAMGEFTEIKPALISASSSPTIR